MHYQESGYGGHEIILTPEETNTIFDPFDISDETLPSHLHRNRHRYIKQEYYDWLVGNIGEPVVSWKSQRSHYMGDVWLFTFNTAGDAAKFKLAFG